MLASRFGQVISKENILYTVPNETDFGVDWVSAKYPLHIHTSTSSFARQYSEAKILKAS